MFCLIHAKFTCSANFETNKSTSCHARFCLGLVCSGLSHSCSSACSELLGSFCQLLPVQVFVIINIINIHSGDDIMNLLLISSYSFLYMSSQKQHNEDEENTKGQASKRYKQDTSSSRCSSPSLYLQVFEGQELLKIVFTYLNDQEGLYLLRTTSKYYNNHPLIGYVYRIHREIYQHPASADPIPNPFFACLTLLIYAPKRTHFTLISSLLHKDIYLPDLHISSFLNTSNHLKKVFFLRH